MSLVRNGVNTRIDFSDLRDSNPAATVKEDRYVLSPIPLTKCKFSITLWKSFRPDGDQLLLFVHGPPGTGKTLLVNRVMKATKRLGLGSKFAACPVTAASINGGCSTLHYVTNLGVRTQPSRDTEEIQQV